MLHCGRVCFPFFLIKCCFHSFFSTCGCVFFILWLCIRVFYKLELFLFLRFQIAMTGFSYVLFLFKMLPYRNLLCFLLDFSADRFAIPYSFRSCFVCVWVFFCFGGGIICSNHTFFALSIVKFRFRLYV